MVVVVVVDGGDSSCDSVGGCVFFPLIPYVFKSSVYILRALQYPQSYLSLMNWVRERQQLDNVSLAIQDKSERIIVPFNFIAR